MRTLSPDDIALTPRGEVVLNDAYWRDRQVSSLSDLDYVKNSWNEGCNNVSSCNSTTNSDCANWGKCVGAQNYGSCHTQEP